MSMRMRNEKREWEMRMKNENEKREWKMRIRNENEKCEREWELKMRMRIKLWIKKKNFNKLSN